MTIEGEIVPVDDEHAVRAVAEIGLLRDPDKVLEEAHKAAAALGRVIAGKPRKVVFNGKQFLEVEDWVLLGQFYGVSGKTEWTRQIEVGEAKGWEARVVVVDQRTGSEVGGAEAMCLNTERNWKSKDDFQLRSMAQTRALSKALSARLRWIPVLAGYSGTPAEEMVAADEGGERMKAPTSAEIEAERKRTIVGATGPLADAVPEYDYMRILEEGRDAKEHDRARYDAFSAWIEAEFGGWMNFVNRGRRRVDEALAILHQPNSITDIKASPGWKAPR